MNQKTLEGLYKKGLITEQTYNNGIKKYADGGAVLEPVTESQIPPETAAVPQSLSPTVDPEIALAAQAAKENTIEQAQNIPGATIERAPANIFEKERQARQNYLQQQTPSPLMQQQTQGSDIVKDAMKGVAEVAAKIPTTTEMASKEPISQAEQLGAIKQPVGMTTKATKAQTPLEGIMGGYDAAFKQQAAGINAEAAAAVTAAKTMTDAYTQSISDFKKFQDEQKVVEQERHNRLATMADKYQGMVDDYQKTAVVDPNRYWANKSDGDKNMARLAIFLGGIGGGTNEVLSQLNRSIDRDIDAQKVMSERKLGGIQLQGNIFNQMMNLTNDDRAASLATKAAMMSNFEMQIKKADASTASPIAKAKAQLLLGNLAKMKADTQVELMKTVQNSVNNLQADNETRQINSLPANLQLKGYEELGKYRQTMSDVELVRNTLSKISDISLAGRLNPADRDAVDTYKTSLIKPIKSMLGEAMQEADVKRLIDPLIPSSLSGKKDAERKTEVFIQNLLSSLPEKTPILTGQGIIKKQTPLNLKRNE